MTMLDELTDIELQRIDVATVKAEVAREAFVTVSTETLRRLLQELEHYRGVGGYDQGWDDGWDARDEESDDDDEDDYWDDDEDD